MNVVLLASFSVVQQTALPHRIQYELNSLKQMHEVNLRDNNIYDYKENCVGVKKIDVGYTNRHCSKSFERSEHDDKV